MTVARGSVRAPGRNEASGRGRAGFVLACVLAAFATQAVHGQTSAAGATVVPRPRELLNSERIEQAFGSYGIEVLESDATLRISNLYSGTGPDRICRTFAVVRYPREVDPRFAPEHAAILAGGSIGATFAAGGWRVVKTHRYLGEIDAPGDITELMGDPHENRLAVDVYTLDVVKDGQRLEYATIAEVHHPDYLRLADLERIYDPERTVPRAPDGAARRLLETVAQHGQP